MRWKCGGLPILTSPPSFHPSFPNLNPLTPDVVDVANSFWFFVQTGDQPSVRLLPLSTTTSVSSNF